MYIPSETPCLRKVNSPSCTPSALRLGRGTCSATAGEAQQWFVVVDSQGLEVQGMTTGTEGVVEEHWTGGPFSIHVQRSNVQ